MNQPIVTIVVPCYNEEQVFHETVLQLTTVLQSLIDEGLILAASKLLFVDDGSKDKTWSLIYEESERNPFITGIKLSRNFGHQRALLAGLEIARTVSDCTISIDADLQDDIHVIRDFILKFHEGYDVVYGVRRKRESDTYFKRETAQGFYRLMKRFGIKLVYNHADYRLLSKRALEELSKFGEANVFLRGIVPLLGFKSTQVEYDRKERFAGVSKYPLRKMLTFAFEGISSFSVAPIRFITLVGFFSFFISSLAGFYALGSKIFGHTELGWTSIMISLWFIGGLLLMSIGLIGEYIGKIYNEVKSRPRYTVETDLFSEKMREQNNASMSIIHG